ncbi:hypothetical protein DCO57_01005 [Labrenzia sp. 011]|nr:hypothetical protein DCO57_01005 [Labrenzia sp. 011]
MHARRAQADQVGIGETGRFRFPSGGKLRGTAALRSGFRRPSEPDPPHSGSARASRTTGSRLRKMQQVALEEYPDGPPAMIRPQPP